MIKLSFELNTTYTIVGVFAYIFRKKNRYLVSIKNIEQVVKADPWLSELLDEHYTNLIREGVVFNIQAEVNIKHQLFNHKIPYWQLV